MNRKRKYRRFVLWCLGLDLLAIGCLRYRYLDRKIPDKLHVAQGQGQDVQELLEHPMLTFEDAITVSQEGSYRIPCKLFGLIPFKEIKVIPTESSQVLISGSAVGIYMETQGVLIVDTGEILSVRL